MDASEGDPNGASREGSADHEEASDRWSVVEELMNAAGAGAGRSRDETAGWLR